MTEKDGSYKAPPFTPPKTGGTPAPKVAPFGNPAPPSKGGSKKP